MKDTYTLDTLEFMLGEAISFTRVVSPSNNGVEHLSLTYDCYGDSVHLVPHLLDPIIGLYASDGVVDEAKVAKTLWCPSKSRYTTYGIDMLGIVTPQQMRNIFDLQDAELQDTGHMILTRRFDERSIAEDVERLYFGVDAMRNFMHETKDNAIVKLIELYAAKKKA